jgi:O-antigen/teichoic acid export membrane protein
MNKTRIFVNAGWIISCKIVKAILTLLVTMLTARYLGPYNYGLINYASGIVAFVTPIMKLGIDAILVHEIIKEPNSEGEILGTSILMNFVSAILCIIGVVAFASIANRGEQDTIIVCTLYSLLLIFQAFEMIQYWFQAKLLSKYTSIAMIISYIVVALFQLFLLINRYGVYWFALSYSIDFGIIAVILLCIYKKKGNGHFKFSYKRSKILLSIGKFYILSNMMTTIFSQTDKIMLKLFLDNTATGYYAAATTCAGMTSFIFAAIIDSARPVIFESKKIELRQFKKSICQLYSVVIYFSLIQCIFMTALAPIIIRILYGTQYVPSVDALRIVVWFTTFSYIGTVRDIWILAENKQSYLWKINAIGAITNIILNSILIPTWGINGAAVASLITQIFTNVIVGFIIKPIKDNNKLLISAIHPKYFIGILRYMKNIIGIKKEV